MNSKTKEIIGVQNSLPTKNPTQLPVYNNITRSLFIDKFSGAHFITNFRFVWEQAKEYLQAIGTNHGVKQDVAVKIAEQEIGFLTEITTEPTESIQNKIDKKTNAMKL